MILIVHGMKEKPSCVDTIVARIKNFSKKDATGATLLQRKSISPKTEASAYHVEPDDLLSGTEMDKNTVAARILGRKLTDGFNYNGHE